MKIKLLDFYKIDSYLKTYKLYYGKDIEITINKDGSFTSTIWYIKDNKNYNNIGGVISQYNYNIDYKMIRYAAQLIDTIKDNQSSIKLNHKLLKGLIKTKRGRILKNNEIDTFINSLIDHQIIYKWSDIIFPKNKIIHSDDWYLLNIWILKPNVIDELLNNVDKTINDIESNKEYTINENSAINIISYKMIKDNFVKVSDDYVNYKHKPYNLNFKQ